jgi:hypothetical protein
MCEPSRVAVANWVRAAAALCVLTALSASPGFAQVAEDATRQCAALTNSVRRLTCYDLLMQLQVTERAETTGQSDGVMTRLDSQQMSKLDVWIEAQPEPKPSRPEAIRRLLDPVLQSQKGSR